MSKHKLYTVRILIKSRLQDGVKRGSKTFRGIITASNKNKAAEIGKSEMKEALKGQSVPILDEDIIVKECFDHSDFVFKQDAK